MQNKHIGLALGSGGIRGIAHIGVIKGLLKRGYKIDLIAGCSSGSIIGGLYAHFQDISKVESLFRKLTYKDYLKIFSDPRISKGFLKGDGATELLRSWIGDVKIEELKIPFKAIATDLVTGEFVYLEKGDLARAIRISASLPVFFRPVKEGKRYLIDGGASMPVPVRAVKEMGAENVIASDLDWCYSSKKNQPKEIEGMSFSDIAERALAIMSYNLAREGVCGADITIRPDIKNGGAKDIFHVDKLIKEGERAVGRVLGKVL